MTHLLEKETPFVFSKECVEAFNALKKKLTEAPILVAPDWDLPFEIMCDASDFAVGAVLGQQMGECLALADLGASINLIPLSVWEKLNLPDLTKTRMILELADRTIFTLTGIAEDVFVKVRTFLFPVDFVVVDYIADPWVPLILGRPFLRTARALIDVHACEEFAQEVLGFSNISKSGNPTPTLEPILSTSPTSLTPFAGGDFILEEIKACLTSESIPPRIDDADFDPKEDLLTLERLLNSDPTSTLPPEEPKFEELKNLRPSEPSSDELPELSSKNYLLSRLRIFRWYPINCPVIIAKDLKERIIAALLVLNHITCHSMEMSILRT
ncbi:reverse transcriptase domain-containing protein [Tanacetum coccineum]